MARKRRGVSWPLDLSTFRWKRPPPSEGQKGGEAPPSLTAHLVVLPKRHHHPVHRRMPAVLHLHPVLRPPGLIVEVVTHNDHATIAAQELLERYYSIRQRHIVRTLLTFPTRGKR